MILRKYLVINSKGSAKVTKNSPKLLSDEIVMELKINIPDAIFKKPSLTAEIKIPEDAVNRPMIAADVAENIKNSLEKISGYDVTLKIEGLQ